MIEANVWDYQQMSIFEKRRNVHDMGTIVSDVPNIKHV